MSMISPILEGAAQAAADVAEVLSDIMSALLQTINAMTGWLDDPADGGLGLVISVLAGVAAALAVAIVVSIYFRSGYRSTRDIVRHGLAAALVIGLIAFAVYDFRDAALGYLGLTAPTATTESAVDLPRTGLLIPGMRRPSLLPFPVMRRAN